MEMDLNLSVLRSVLADVDEPFLRRLVAEGETRAVERKLKPTGIVLGEAASSFANTLGGWILLGVEDHVLAGKSAADQPAPQVEGWSPPGRVDVQDWVREQLRQQVDPIPPFAARMVDLAGRSVGVVRVYESVNTPHVVRRTGAVYVRGQGGKEPATHADVAQLAAKGADAATRAIERLDLLPGLDSSDRALPPLPTGSKSHIRRIRLRIAPLTTRPGFQDDVLATPFVNSFEEKIFPLVCGVEDLTPRNVVSQYGFRFEASHSDLHRNGAIVWIAGADGRGAVEVGMIRASEPDDARRIRLEIQQRHFQAFFTAATAALRAIESFGEAFYWMDFQPPSNSYITVPDEQAGGSQRAVAALRFPGRIVIPSSEPELRAEAERCVRQLARAGGLAAFEPARQATAEMAD